MADSIFINVMINCQEDGTVIVSIKTDLKTSKVVEMVLEEHSFDFTKINTQEWKAIEPKLNMAHLEITSVTIYPKIQNFDETMLLCRYVADAVRVEAMKL